MSLPKIPIGVGFPLYKGVEYINDAIEVVNKVQKDSSNALNTAKQANTKSNQTQQQLDNIVLNNGESDAEVLQARGPYSLLVDRFEQLERNVVSITDKRFGGEVDGITNDTVAFNAAQDYLVSVGGGKLLIPSGVCILDPIVIKKGIYVIGAGTSLIFDYMQGVISGTILLINGGAGDDCLTFEEEKNVMGLKDLSIFNNTSNAIHSVVRIKGNSFVQLRDIEISGTQVCDGTGLYVDPYIGTRTNGAHYNYHYNVSVVGNYLKNGIYFRGYAEYEGANSNIFYGGRVNGWNKSLILEGYSTNNGAVNNLVFNDITFEHVFNPNSPINYYSETKHILGLNSPVYGVKFIDIKAGKQNLFKGCRFEHGNTPSSYNDGINGTANVVGLIMLTDSVRTTNNQFIGDAYFNVYFWDQGHRTVVSGEKSGLNILPSTKPSILLEKTTSQTIPSSTATPILFDSIESNEILYSSGNITFKQDGMYQINAQLLFADFPADKRMNVCIHKNGQNFHFVGTYGRTVPYGGSNRITSSISVLIKAAKMDTFKIIAYHEAGVSQNLSGFRDSTWCQIFKV